MTDSRIPVLIVTRGLPGSGKSTWARRWVAEDTEHRAEVNRDQLRVMMHGGWAAAEPQVTVAAHAAITALLGSGISVVCSDTNLPDRRVLEFAALARRAAVAFRIENFTNVPLGVCIARDAARADKAPVGEQVIRSMYQQFLAGHDLPLATPALTGMPVAEWSF
jgi:predicted kinase